jgi:hypothetical protein
MFPSQNEAHSHDHAQDKADDKTETGCVSRGSLAQIKNPGRQVLVHTLKTTYQVRSVTCKFIQGGAAASEVNLGDGNGVRYCFRQAVRLIRSMRAER